MSKLKFVAILSLILICAAVFTYFFGFANTVILVTGVLHFAAARMWAVGIKKLIVDSQHILGENDKKLLKRLVAVESKLDDR